MLVAMAGLPGTGKSTLVAGLATSLEGVVLSKDEVRAALFPPRFVEYSTEQDDLCVSILLQAAGFLFKRDPTLWVFVDGRTFSRWSQLHQLADFAEATGVPLKVIECVCSERTALERLERDRAEGQHPARNRGLELYQSVKARFEPIPEPKLVVDTDRPLEECLTLCRAYLQAGSPQTSS
ncbi:MAG: ATP-binding protein [Chloroflexota bacterium]|nr:ATP-binding protein [Chloroflexota bacterium]